jgi:putative Flp pilus-assembly TadE/G-like protein
MLVQIALMAVVLCGLLSLVIDVGYTRLTRGQMQNAADTAALEGLRKRDVGVRNPITGQTVNDAFASDCLRRAAANRIVRWTFDDNLEPADGDPDYQFGAGPVIDLTEGVTSLHGLQTISVPETHSYKPDLQLNQLNQVHGDMVSGRFCYTPDPAPSEGPVHELQDEVCTEPQRGSGTYARNDFNPNLTSPGPPPGLNECPAPDDPVPSPWPLPGTGSLAGVDDSAFLVRLRRSNEFGDPGAQLEPGVGSSGPSLPLTAGKATTIFGDDPASSYSVRRDGLTVRATAIATIRPAMHVGLPQVNPAQPGVTRFALLDTCVQAPTGAPVTITVTVNPATGIITRTGPGTPTCATGAVVGRFVPNPVAVSTVGNTLPLAPSPIACTAATSVTAQYGPVFSVMAAGPPRVIGFARVTFTRVAVCPAPVSPFTATITRLASIVAASNASASPTGTLPMPITATPADVRELFDRNRVRNGRVNYAPVLVAALAR